MAVGKAAPSAERSVNPSEVKMLEGSDKLGMVRVQPGSTWPGPRIESAGAGIRRGEAQRAKHGTIVMIIADHLQPGNSELWVEGDVVFVKRDGETTLEKMETLLRTVEETRRRHGRVYVVLNLTRMTAFPMEVRNRLAKSMRENRPTAVACFGAGFTLQTLTKLFAKAMSLVGFPLVFGSFATEYEARGWIDAQRQQQHHCAES